MSFVNFVVILACVAKGDEGVDSGLHLRGVACAEGVGDLVCHFRCVDSPEHMSLENILHVGPLLGFRVLKSDLPELLFRHDDVSRTIVELLLVSSEPSLAISFH